jgi:DNA-binding MarR family transcriptional regulator
MDGESITKRLRPDRADPAGEFPSDATSYVFHLFSVATRHREARVDELLKPLGLNLPRYIALNMIARFQPCSMTHLAGYSALDRTTLTRITDQLVRANLVERTTPPNDRRQVLLTITPAGRDMQDVARKLVEDLNDELVENLPDADQRAIARGFEKIVAKLATDPGHLKRLLLEDDDLTG